MVLMREPVSRMNSEFYFNYQLEAIEKWPKGMKKNSSAYFHKYVQKAITEFNNCLRNSSLYECTTNKATINNSKLGLV